METRAKKKTLPIILASLLCAVLAIFGLSNLSVFTSNRVKAADAEVGTEAELTNALSNGSNVKFTADITLENVLVVGKDAIIDLNGKTLTAKAFGKYKLSSDGCYTGLVINDNAVVTVKNGTLTSDYATTSDQNIAYSSYVVLADDSSALTLDNVSVIGQNASEANGTRMSGGIIYDSTGSLTLVGSKVASGDNKGLNLNYNSAAAIQTKSGCGGSIVVSSSEIYGGKSAGAFAVAAASHGIYLGGSASLEINNSAVKGGDAEKTGGNSVYIAGSGEVKIIDSEIYGGNSTDGIGGDSVYVNSNSCKKVTVTGSTVAGGNGGTSWNGSGICFSRNIPLEATDSTIKTGDGENAEDGSSAAVSFYRWADDSVDVTFDNVTLAASKKNTVMKNAGVANVKAEGNLVITEGTLDDVVITVASGAKVSVAGNVTMNETAVIEDENGSAVIPEEITAKVGGTYYADLASAIAALNGVNHTLELLSDSEWDSATPVYYKSGAAEGYSATLSAALTAAYMANEDDIIIVCRPGADVGTMTHGHVEDNLVIYGNNAYISGGECDLEVDTFIFSRATGRQATAGDYLQKDVAITAYELDNLGVWGQRHTDKTVTVTLVDCDGKAIAGKENVQRVYISGATGKNVISVSGCDFITGKTSVYSNADGSVTVENCSFTGSDLPVNINHKADGEILLTVKNSSFNACGDDGEWSSFAAPVRFVNSGNGSLASTVESCSFENTVGVNGDILLGDGRENAKSNDLELTVINTAANVTAQKPGYYDASGAVADVTLAGTKVSPAEGTLDTSVDKLAKLADYTTIELVYGANVDESDKAAAMAMYDGVKYTTNKAANEAYMALFGVTWNKTYLDVTDTSAPLYKYIATSGSVTEVKFYVHGKMSGFTSLTSNGNQTDCEIGGNHQMFRTSYSVIGVDDEDGKKAQITDGNLRAYVAGGYDSMFTYSGTLTIDNIEFTNTYTTTVGASAAVASSSSEKRVTSAEMIIKNCVFRGRLYVYDNFVNENMTYTIENNVFDGSNYSGDSNAYSIFAQCRGGNNLIIKNNEISGFARGINIDHSNVHAEISGNEISITDSGRSCVQLSSLASANITENVLNLTGGNAITLHSKLLTMSGVPEISVTDNTVNGNGYFVYDDAKASGKEFTKANLIFNCDNNTVATGVDTTKGVKDSSVYDNAGYVNNVVNGLYGTEKAPYTLEELSVMTRAEYIAAQERLGGTMYVDVGTYSYDVNGVLGNGTINSSDRDTTKLNCYAQNGYLGDKNDGANGKNIVFVGTSVSNNATGYESIDGTGTNLVLGVPAYTNVTFKGIAFNGVFTFSYQIYTSPWSQLGELKFDNCEFNGLIVGAISAQTLNFTGCTFTSFENTVSANNSNPVWVRPAYGNWVVGDNTSQGNNFRSLTSIVFENNTVTGIRPVKFERIAQWEMDTKVEVKGNAFDITSDGGSNTKNVGLYFGANAKFDLVLEGNTKSTETAALYTAVYGAPDKKSYVGLPAGSTVKNAAGEDITSSDALAWKTNDQITLATTKEVFAVNGKVNFATLEEAINAAANNETITVLCDATVGGKIIFPAGKTLTFDLNGKNITATGDEKGFWANVEGDVTFTGSGYLGDKTHDSVGYLIYLVGSLTVNGNATYESGLTVVQVSAAGAKLVINGGNHIGGAYEGKYWTVNIIDAYRDDVTVKINGGTFYNFDPRNSEVEGNGTNFLAPEAGVDFTQSGENGSFTVKPNMSAQIVDANGNSVKAYATLKEAVDAAKSGEVIKLLKNIDLDEQIAISEAITIDGDGKYEIKATKTIKGASGKSGMFYRVTSAKGTLTFKNVTLNGNNLSKIFLNEGGAGTTVFNGVTSKNGGGIAYGAGIHISGGGSHAEIINSVLTGSVGTTELNETNYYAANDLWVGGNVDVTVENSTIGTVFVNSTSTLTARHGHLVIKGDTTQIGYLSGDNEAADKEGNVGSVITITGGNVDTIFDKGIYSITGGTFGTEIKPEWCADGFIPKANDDGTYGVKEGYYVASVNGVGYETLDEAMSAAVSGETVTLLVDINIEGPSGLEFNVAGGITVDLNGHSIDGTKVNVNYLKCAALGLVLSEESASTISIVNGSATESVITAAIPVKIGNSNDDLKLTIGENVKLVVTGSGNPVVLDTHVYMENTDKNAAYFKVGGFRATKNGVTRIYDQLSSAVNYGEAVMMNDYTTVSGLKIWNTWGTPVLDLGGKTYTYTGSENAFDMRSGSTLTLKNGKFVSNGVSAIALTDNDITLNLSGVELECNGNYGVVTNGQKTNDKITIANSKITAVNGTGVFFPSTGSLTITNSVITGKVGVQVCAGSLSISGNETVITGSGTVETPTASGSVMDGSAVSIIARSGYGSLVSVSVSGGKFVSEHGVALKAYVLNGTTESAFDNADKLIKVIGGTFTSEIDRAYCADGYILAENDEGNFVVREGEYVAKIGDKCYATIKEAINAANVGDKIVLIGNATENVEIAAGKDITLDLNGYTLSGGVEAGKATILNKGKIVITDGSAAKSGTIKREDNGTSGYYVIRNLGEMTIEEAIITNNSGYRKDNPSGTMVGSSLICNGDDDGYNAVLNIKGGKISQKNFIAIKNGSSATLTVTGGEIESEHSAIQNWCNLTVTGGKLKGQLWTDAYDATSTGHTVIGGEAEFEGEIVMDITGSIAPVLEVTGGTLNVSNWRITSGCAAAGGKPSVSGGTFNTEVPADYCADGFIPKANDDGTYGVKEGYYVASVNGVGYETLKEAIIAAKDGETIVVAAGEYKIPGDNIYGEKTITVKAADGAEVAFDMSNAIAIHGAKVIFENVTFNYKTNGNYIGLQHASDLTYNNCKINGQVFLYATNETFNKCTFTQDSANSYNVWTYGAKNVTFNECVFNCVGKSVLLYNEGSNSGTDLTVTKTTFNASAPVEGKAAIEIDTSLMEGGSKITVDGETSANGFADGSNSGNSLWNDKKQTVESNKNVTVIVDNDTVYTPVVAKINDKYYATVVEAIAAAKSGDVIILIKDAEVSEVLTVNTAITIDLNGKTLTNNVEREKDGYSLITNAAVTLKNGTYKATHENSRAICANADFTLSNATIESAGLVGIAFSGNGSHNSITDSTVRGGYAISSFADNSTISISNSNIEARTCGFYHNGTNKNLTLNVENTSIISGTGEVSSANDNVTGVYISGKKVNGYHNVTLKNCTVSGGTAVEVKFTNLTVEGGRFTATASKEEYIQNNNGAASRGFAIVSTDNAKNNETPAPLGTINISGNGVFSGTVGLGNSAAVKAAYPDLTDADYEISGGTFSNAVGDDYCVNGYKVERNSDGTYGVTGVIEVWTGFSASDKVASFDSISDAMAYVLTLGNGVTRRVVVNGKYVLESDITISENTYLDVLGTLIVNDGVTVNVDSNRLGVWAGGKVVNNGTVILLGENAKVMVQTNATFEGNAISAPDGWWIYLNGNSYAAIEIATAAVKIEYKDGTKGYYNSNVNVKNAKKVTLQRDFGGTLNFSGSVSDPFDVEIDLCGHTISADTFSSGVINLSNGKFVIKNGTVKSLSTNGSNKGALNIYSGADVTVANDVILDGGTNQPAAYLQGGSLTLYGTAKTEGSVAITTQGLNEHNTLITIKDGATVLADNGIAIYNPIGELVIEGGSIKGATGVQICSGKLTISGGTITATGADESAGCNNAVTDGAAVSILNRNYPGGIPSVTITGGTFVSETEAAIRAYDWTNNVKADWAEAKNYVSVSGGKFSSIPANMTDLCKDGFVPVKSADGTYRVVAGSYVAKIGEEAYITLEDALKAAVSGDTVVLLADITTSGTEGIEVKVKGGITLDLNGHSIDGTNATAKNASALKLTATERTDSAITIVNNGAAQSVITGILPVKIVNGNYDLKLVIGENIKLNVIGNGNAVYLDKCVYMDNTDKNAAYFKVGGFRATKNGVTRIYERLSSAVNYGEAVMMNDYTTDTALNIWNSWGTPVLDLGGKTYTYTGKESAFDLYDGGANITFKNGKIVSNGVSAIALTENNTTLRLDGVEIVSDGDYGVVSNGSYENVNVTIENSRITAINGTGVYFPSTGSLAIANSVITGKVGVQVCAGSLSISGNETVITGNGTVETPTANGSVMDGSAVSIIAREGYGALVSVSISGGKFVSEHGVAVKAYVLNGTTESAFDNTAKVIVITGGKYNAVPDYIDSLCESGCRAAITKEGVYEIVEKQLAISATLGEDISLNYYVKRKTDNTKVTVKYVKNGEAIEEVLTEFVAVSGSKYAGRFVFRGLTPQMLDRGITVMYEDGDLKDAIENYSIADYLIKVATGAGNAEKAKRLASDTLYYGIAAMKYVGTETLVANANALKARVTELGITQSEVEMVDTSISEATEKIVGVTVMFDNKNSLVFRVKDDVYEEKAGYRYYLSSKKFTKWNVTAIPGYHAYISEPIKATGIIGNKLTFEVTDGLNFVQKVSYDVASYCAKIYAMDSASEQLKELAKATYCYGYSARQYANA